MEDYGMLALYTLRGFLSAKLSDKDAFKRVGDVSKYLESEGIFDYRTYITFKAISNITGADFSTDINNIIQIQQITETLQDQLNKIVNQIVVPMIESNVPSNQR